MLVQALKDKPFKAGNNAAMSMQIVEPCSPAVIVALTEGVFLQILQIITSPATLQVWSQLIVDSSLIPAWQNRSISMLGRCLVQLALSFCKMK